MDQYYFYVRDHLGSNRVVVNQNGVAEQRVDFYPYGGTIPGNLNAEYQPWLYNGKEKDMTGLDWYDYGARFLLKGRWTTPDPLSEKYFSISPYAYCMNNPLRYIDPDGMDIWEMDYEGKVMWKDESKQHTMYALDKDGNRTGQSLTLKDRGVFDQLAKSGKESGYRGSYAKGNPGELAAVFLFGADNTNVEWRFSRYDEGNGDQYALGTRHSPDRSPLAGQMGFNEKSEIAFVHSHPGVVPQTNIEYGTMGWTPNYIYPTTDADNVDRFGGIVPSMNYYYTYFPNSGNIYQVRGVSVPAFIRNIQNHNYNPQRLFWGTLNAK